jgi:tRNA modification GTPase
VSTYAAQLTPAGVGAVATLAVEGPRAWEIVSKLFRPMSDKMAWPPAEPRPDQFWLGRLGDPPTGKTADEVVLAAPQLHPFPRVEIHCHGGTEVVRLLLEILAERGVTICSPSDLQRYTSDDPFRAHAASVLADALTIRTAGILLDQYHGALRCAVNAVQAALKGGDEEESGRQLEELLQHAGVGRHLTQPWRVAVMGAPNVGKSSLVNALAGYQRSIVAAVPGTTRDVVTTMIAADGWPVELADTAGLQATNESLEAQGMRRAWEAGRAADLRLWVLDASARASWPESGIGEVHLVVNKIDQRAAWDLAKASDAVRVSARTGEGVPELLRRLAHWLVPNPPSPGTAVPFTPELVARLEAAKKCVDRGDVRGAAEVLG